MSVFPDQHFNPPGSARGERLNSLAENVAEAEFVLVAFHSVAWRGAGHEEIADFDRAVFTGDVCWDNTDHAHRHFRTIGRRITVHAIEPEQHAGRASIDAR